MIRTFAIAGGLALVAAAPAGAQTWGQPVYVSPYGHVVGGTPLSEVETRPYVETGRWADGYTDQAYVYVPAPVYGRSYGYGARGYGHGYGYNGYGYGERYGYSRRDARSQGGYRDWWGYNDDRPPVSRRGYVGRYDHGCGCGDVYLYDR